MDSSGDIMRLCRLCLVKEQVNIPIFEDQGDIRQIFLKISSCLPVKVSRDDNLPKKICDGCSGKLDLLYDFWNTSANAEKTLLSWLGEAGIKEQDVEDKLSAVQQMHHESKGIVKQETVDPTDANFFSNFENSFGDAPTKKVTKKEKDAHPPPPKRARRSAAVKAQINISRDSDDDDDMDATEPLTKIEDESDSDADPSYGEVPGTSADDQPGPSGMSKDGVEAPIESEPGSIEKTQVCKICNKKYSSREKLENHLEVLIMKPQFFCRQCGKVVSSGAIVSGNQDYAGVADVLCGVCNSVLEKENILAPSCFHEEIDLNSKNEKQFDMSLLNSISDNLSEETVQSSPKKHKRSKEERRTEMLKFFEENGIDHDLNENQRPTECTICHVFFKTMPEKRRHKKLFHRVIQICPLCGYSTPHASSYSRHMYNHKNERNVKCDVCFKGFNTRHALRRHQLVHDEVGKHQCTICGKTFKKRYNLNVHVRIHTDDKPYECSCCDRSFRTKQSRDNHAKSHL